MTPRLLPFVAIALMSAASPSASAQNPCGRSSSLADREASSFGRIASGTDTASARLRSAFRLDQIYTASAVYLVPDTLVCRRAANAYAAALSFTDSPSLPVWVIRLGSTRYVVFNLAHSNTNGSVQVVFDSAFIVKSRILGP